MCSINNQIIFPSNSDFFVLIIISGFTYIGKLLVCLKYYYYKYLSEGARRGALWEHGKHIKHEGRGETVPGKKPDGSYLKSSTYSPSGLLPPCGSIISICDGQQSSWPPTETR